MNQIANNYNSLNGNRMFGTGTNFGDPVCSFTQSKLRAVINDLEPKVVNRDFWIEIAKCESPGNGPNGWSSSFNAWGQFQMGRSNPRPGKPYDPNDQPTRGDLPWQRQVQNAIRWNNARAADGNNFVYWETAYCLCGTASHRGQPYCADIIRQGLEKSCSSCP